MSHKKMPKKLTKVRDEFVLLESLSWRDMDLRIISIRDMCDEKLVKSIFLNYSNFEYVFGASSDRRRNWTITKFVGVVLPCYPKVGDKILKDSNIDLIKTIVVERGAYTDVKLLDHVALHGDGDSQVAATKFCSTDVLRSLKSSKSTRVRRIVYERLGPVECLDDMLDDKIASIREDGLRRAPYYYDKLKQFTSEIARGPFSILVEKIPLDYLPMLMANRNVKNSWISSKFESRMSSGR